MPDATDVFGIPYPCLGEVVGPAAFNAYSAAVEAALAVVDVSATRALLPPGAGVGLSQAVAVGVATNCTYTAEYWDDVTNMATVGTTSLTAPTNGIYLATANISISGFTTLTSLKAGITVNGTEIYAGKNAGGTSSPWEVPAEAELRLTGGDAVRIQATWTGTGGPATVTGVFTLTLVSRQF